MKKDWNKEFKKLTTSKASDPSKAEPTPYRDWRLLVSGFFVLLVISVGFNIYMSIEINRDSFFTTTPKTGEGVVFNGEGLAAVLEDLAMKEAAFERLITEGVSVVDPSL